MKMMGQQTKRAIKREVYCIQVKKTDATSWSWLARKNGRLVLGGVIDIRKALRITEEDDAMRFIYQLTRFFPGYDFKGYRVLEVETAEVVGAEL